MLIAVSNSSVTAPEQVPQLAATARKANQKKVLVRIEQREGNTRFVALPLETG